MSSAGPGGGRSGGSRLIGAIAAVAILAMILMFFKDRSVPASSLNREKADTGVAFRNDCVVDELGWFDNVVNIERRLQNFYNVTGVQPYVVLRGHDESLKTDREKKAFAKQYYEDNIDNEGTFLFVCFAGRDADNDESSMTYANGRQITSVMDAEAVDIFEAYFQESWGNGSLSRDDAVVLVFDKTAKRIMTKTTTGKDIVKQAVSGLGTIVKYIVVGISAIIVIVLVICFFHERARRKKEENEETAAILNAPINTLADKLADEYDDGSPSHGDTLLDKYYDIKKTEPCGKDEPQEKKKRKTNY